MRGTSRASDASLFDYLMKSVRIIEPYPLRAIGLHEISKRKERAMNNVISIQSRRSVARPRPRDERIVAGRRERGTFLGQHMIAAIPLQAIDNTAIAQWEKTVRHTTLATVTAAILVAGAIGAFGLPGLM